MIKNLFDIFLVYVAAYVVLAMVMLGAALSGTVWIAYIFGQK